MYKAYIGAIRPARWGGMATATYKFVFAETDEEARELLIAILEKDPKRVMADETCKAMRSSGNYAIQRDLDEKGLLWLDWGEFDFHMHGVPMGINGGLGEIIEAYEKLRVLNS